MSIDFLDRVGAAFGQLGVDAGLDDEDDPYLTLFESLGHIERQMIITIVLSEQWFAALFDSCAVPWFRAILAGSDSPPSSTARILRTNKSTCGECGYTEHNELRPLWPTDQRNRSVNIDAVFYAARTSLPSTARS